MVLTVVENQSRIKEQMFDLSANIKRKEPSTS